MSDYTLLKRVLRYVKGTLPMGINFNNECDNTLRAYSDSDWGGCKSTRRSTGGFCTFLGTNIISWSSKKQNTVSRSSTEAEYRSLSDTAQEITWISAILKEIGIPLPVTPELYGDNLSSVYLTANPAFHARSKHFEIDYHYVRERVALGSLIVKHVPATQQIADIFTKSLGYQAFTSLRYKLGVVDPPTSRLRGSINATAPANTENRDVNKGKEILFSQNGNVSTIGSIAETNRLGLTKTKPNTQATSFKEHWSPSLQSHDKKIKTEVSTEEIKLSNQFAALDLLEATG